MSDITCTRCHLAKPMMETPPLPTVLGQKLQSEVCAECWADWKRTELMVINEYRLNMMDKGHRETLTKQMKAFFTGDTPKTDYVPETK